MNRRRFLTRCAAGCIGGMAALHLPASLFKGVPAVAAYAREGASLCLQRAWVAFENRRGYLPDGFFVGREFYALYEHELLIRQPFMLFDEPPIERLVFKGVPVEARGRGYLIRPYGRPDGIVSRGSWHDTGTLEV